MQLHQFKQATQPAAWLFSSFAQTSFIFNRFISTSTLPIQDFNMASVIINWSISCGHHFTKKVVTDNSSDEIKSSTL
jgi:uncharacterized membrane protein AbrB (regulator of aidB expression)